MTQARDKFKAGGRRTQVRKSSIHGKGVYAIRSIKAGDRVLEYKGKIITWRKAQALHPHDPSQPRNDIDLHILGAQGGDLQRI